MQDLRTPKIILNDDYVDLRENRRDTVSDYKKTSTYTTTSKRTPSVNSESGDCNDKDLINTGLRKLITNFNSAPSKMQSQNRTTAYSRSKFKPRENLDTRFRRKLSPEKKSFMSHSESTLQHDKMKLVRNPSCSTPSVSEKAAQNAPNYISIKEDLAETAFEDKCTMTDFKLSLTPTAHRNVESKESTMKSPCNSTSFIRNLDPRLLEKYPDILQKPCFKRSWTVPFLGRTSNFLGSPYDRTSNRDKASTYLYDEGSEIDSTIIEMQKIPSTSSLQALAKSVLFCVASLCGILLVSAIIWLLFGKDMVTHFTNNIQYFARRRQTDENILKRAVKWFTGSVLYVVNTFVMTLFRIVTIQTNEVLGHSEG